jgi:hypothetical protein
MRLGTFEFGSIRDRWSYLQPGRRNRPRQDSKTKEEAVEAISRIVRPHSPHNGGRDFPGDVAGWWSARARRWPADYDDVVREAQARNVALVVVPTAEAIEVLNKADDEPTHSCTLPAEPNARAIHVRPTPHPSESNLACGWRALQSSAVNAESEDMPESLA